MFRLFSFCVLGMLCAYSPFSAYAALPPTTITLAADNWCPFTCDDKSENPGFMVEIAKAAFKPYNISVQYKVISWARAIEMARNGKVTGIIGASHDDAPDFVFPSTLQGLSSMNFWVKKDSQWQFDSIASLGKVKIGIASDYAYGKILDQYLKVHSGATDHIQEVNNADALSINLRKLNAGMIDALPEDKSVISYYFSSRGLAMNIKSAGAVVDRSHIEDNFLYIAFGPNNPKAKYYADIMAKGMHDLRKSGELKKILDKYQIEDWHKASGM